MLKKDMLCLVTYWAEQIQIVLKTTTLTPNTVYSRGARCLMEKSKVIDVFDGIIELPSSIIELRTLCSQT